MLTLNNIKLLFLILICFILFIIYMNLSTTPIELDLEHMNIAEVLLDHRSVPSEAEIFEGIAREIPSSPIEFWQRNRRKKLQLNETCALYPRILNLHYHNTYWQKYTNLNLTYYLYGAYYDNRPLAANNGPVVRIMALVNQISEKFPPEYCQMWFDETTEPSIVPVTDYNDMWQPNWTTNKTNLFFPVFINCIVPRAQHDLIPQTVSLVTRECATATNNLKVTYEMLKDAAEKKGRFVVCVKAMWYSYTDMSARLVEWLEMLRLLGAEKVNIYNLQTHPNNTRVLEYYHRRGFVDYPGYAMGRGEPNTPNFSHMVIKGNLNNYRLNQMIQLNDCFYRNMYRYDYVALFDIDELIMPMGDLKTWPDIMAMYEKSNHSSCDSCHCFRNAYFPRYPGFDRYSLELPEYMYMMQHVRREREISKVDVATKCFHNTAVVIVVHNHYPRISVANCFRHQVNVSIGQLQHYREVEVRRSLENSVIDNNIWRFKGSLVPRSLNVLKELGYFPKNYKNLLTTDIT